jgi:hypothetical protein
MQEEECILTGEQLTPPSDMQTHGVRRAGRCRVAYSLLPGGSASLCLSTLVSADAVQRALDCADFAVGGPRHTSKLTAAPPCTAGAGGRSDCTRPA